MTQSTAIQKMDDKGIVLDTMTDVHAFALTLCQSSMCPQAYRGKPADAAIAIVAGRAVGLTPLQALSGIAVIGGRPSMFGEARAAVVLASNKAEWIKEWFEFEGEVVEPQGTYDIKTAPPRLVACWQAKRKDQSEPTEVVRFAVGDAKLAGLWGKSGPWSQYPLRMLRMRARAFGERDYFADATHGIAQGEEMMDIKRHGKDKLEVLAEDDESPPPVEKIDGEMVGDAPQARQEPDVAPESHPVTFPAVWACWQGMALEHAQADPENWQDFKKHGGRWFGEFASSILGRTVAGRDDLTPDDLASVMADLDRNGDPRPMDNR